ncbi:MAG: threonine dehydratase [Rhizobiales bacterium]|nr:threonine dehydratase [Hyphomicrobiales bacterium]
MALFTLDDIRAAQQLIYREMPPTPQYSWPLINAAVGTQVWVKHENHTPTGAFKIRGGITFMDWLKRTHPDMRGIVTATRGNHGQAQARAAIAAGLIAKILVPIGNSVEKNAAMTHFGGEVIEAGIDFDMARGAAARIAKEENLFLVPSFHPELLRGVATYALEFFSAVPDLDTVYVPIGCGSGICSMILVRDMLGLKTKIVGVVSQQADCAKQSVEAGRLIETASANTLADGMAVRIPVPEAFEIYAKGADHIVAISDDEVADAMRLYFSATHNVAEGAGAAPLAALMQERAKMAGKKAGIILCGGNVDSALFARVLNGETPIF